MRACAAVRDCHAVVFLAQTSGNLPATVPYSGVVLRGRITGTVAANPPGARHANLNQCSVQGALGCSTLSDNYEPEEVNLPKDTAKVAAGHYHSLAINGDGKLWSWGYVYFTHAIYCSNGKLVCADQQCSSNYDIPCRRNAEGQLGRGIHSQDPVATPAAVEALASFRVCALWHLHSTASHQIVLILGPAWLYS